MAGKTLINGVARTITGGTDLIDGVSRKRKSGKVLVNGVARTIVFAEPYNISITGTTNYESAYAYVVYKGTQHYADETITVNAGDSVTVVVKATKAGSGVSTKMYINLNGSEVAAGTAASAELSYEYTPKADATIEFKRKAGGLTGYSFAADITEV